MGNPECHIALRVAARQIADQADQLTASRTAHHEYTGWPDQVDEQTGRTRAPGEATGEPGPRATSSLRAAWDRFREIERRVSDSLFGDTLGGISILIIATGATVLLPLFLGR
ncbi:hypothetical protein [Citreimonas sp.]|uniref:hypothetical protein n=1 Tax=Citreimonas sp. TaxID=3036715 RepID=UPI0035C8777A